MKMSQREARSWKKRALAAEETLSQQRNQYVRDWPGGVNLGQIVRPDDWLMGRISAARSLKHAVVVTVNDSMTKLDFYAVKLPA